MRLQRIALIPLAGAVLGITACATGSAIVTGSTRAPTAVEQVKIYLDPPADYEAIGLVSASSGAGWTEQGSVDYAVAELKHQAAKLGANGVLLVASTYAAGTTYAGPDSAKTVQGKAIIVNVR